MVTHPKADAGDVVTPYLHDLPAVPEYTGVLQSILFLTRGCLHGHYGLIPSAVVISYLHFSSARRALVHRVAMPISPDAYHLYPVMVVIAIGFLEFCHGISLWMNRSVDYKNLFLLNLYGT
jgi:hypothetical protein